MILRKTLVSENFGRISKSRKRFWLVSKSRFCTVCFCFFWVSKFLSASRWVSDFTIRHPCKSASFLNYPLETGFYLDGGKSKINMATKGFLVGDHSIRPRRAVRYVANKQASKTAKRKKKKPEWDVSRIYVRYIRYKFISLRKFHSSWADFI